MPAENTDLERRVLAHEQILQALMAQLTESEPGFLDRMSERFATARRGSYEHEYLETADYAEAFLHEVIRLSRKSNARPASDLSAPSIVTAGPVAPPRGAPATIIRTASAGGVWRVTRDDVFLGDYLAEAPARAAATKASREIEDAGGRTKLIFGEPH